MEWLSDEQQRIWRDYLAMTGGLHTAMHRQLQQDCELSLSDYDVLVAAVGAGAAADQRPRRTHRVGTEPGVSPASPHARAWAWWNARVTTTTGGSRPSRSPTRGPRRLEAAAPGHVELVRSVLFDGLTAAQQRAFGSAIETILARIRTGKPS